MQLSMTGHHQLYWNSPHSLLSQVWRKRYGGFAVIYVCAQTSLSVCGNTRYIICLLLEFRCEKHRPSEESVGNCNVCFGYSWKFVFSLSCEL